MIQVEAEACGTPVISINTGGPADTIIHGKTGYLASIGEEIKLDSEWAWEHMGFDADHRIQFDEPKTFAYRANIDDLAKYTLELLQDDKKREEMGQNAWEYAQETFHYKRIAGIALDNIQKMVEIKKSIQ
jgi:alpha-maltose-1-phosphate synthase